ncbi:unnamed protein product [Mesocestoides corti]|uniref:Uncharacterized protein n=1 Tax=Mesocestoides corti TaxID=53468 RepID=A0A0R3UJU2_MESCO|nr:unnamed protein product [Mesocestoides corti]
MDVLLFLVYVLFAALYLAVKGLVKAVLVSVTWVTSKILLRFRRLCREIVGAVDTSWIPCSYFASVCDNEVPPATRLVEGPRLSKTDVCQVEVLEATPESCKAFQPDTRRLCQQNIHMVRKDFFKIAGVRYVVEPRVSTVQSAATSIAKCSTITTFASVKENRSLATKHILIEEIKLVEHSGGEFFNLVDFSSAVCSAGLEVGSFLVSVDDGNHIVDRRNMANVPTGAGGNLWAVSRTASGQRDSIPVYSVFTVVHKYIVRVVLMALLPVSANDQVRLIKWQFTPA